MESPLMDIAGSLQGAVQAKYLAFVDSAPLFLGAAAVLLLGLALAELAYRLVLALSSRLRIESLSRKLGLSPFLERHKVGASSSKVVAQSLKGYLIFLFFVESTKIAGFYQVSDFLDTVMGYLPDMVVAALIMLAALNVASGVSTLIRTSLSFTRSTTANVLGIAAKYAILTFAVLAALSQLEIAPILIQTLFVGFVAMLTLAGGLAFGLGGKDVVRELLEAIKKVEIREYQKSLAEQRQETREETVR